MTKILWYLNLSFRPRDRILDGKQYSITWLALHNDAKEMSSYCTFRLFNYSINLYIFTRDQYRELWKPKV